MSAVPPPRALAWRTRAEFRAAEGVLLVLREPPAPLPPAQGQPPAVPANPAEGSEVLLALADDGHAVLLAGHVDLGTGIRTAYGQIAADELDLPMDRLHVVLGDTARAPNQGPTIASTSIQLHAQPLKLAAAQARRWLLARAAAHWGLAPEALRTADGVVHAPDGRQLAYAALVAGVHAELMLDPATPVKAAGEHRLVGQSVPRVDLVDKVTGQAVYVHDVRLPGMLHGRVVRPPYAGLDAGDFVGRSLLRVDEASIAHLPGIVAVVVEGDFVGIVAEREEVADAAMHALRVEWAPFTPAPPLDDLAQAISANPGTARVVSTQGEVEAALAGAAQRLDRTYVWPYQLHASIGPSCAVAQWQGPAARATVWAGTQNPHVLRHDLSRLTGLPDVAIEVIRLEAAGCYGRNGADDVAADALLLARAVAHRGVAVRVQLTRAQEHAWEPKGAAQLMQVKGGLDAQGALLAYDFQTSYPSNGAPTLALLLTGRVPAVRQAFEMGDRTAVPPYGYAHQRITVHDMAPILRASWLRGVSALPNSFAHESYIDELAHAAGEDPVAYRLKHLADERAAELVRATAAKAGWVPHTRPGSQGAEGDWLDGQGFAYARYVHSKFPGFGAAWSAWVADVSVHRVTGEVQVKRVVLGQDSGLMVNPKGIEQQVHGNVLQTTSRALKERLPVTPDTRTPAALDWGAYPILNFREVPVVDVLLVPRPGEPPLGVGESASVPGTAAIANAIFDATGVRLRQPPFTPEVVRAALAEAGVGGLPAADEPGGSRVGPHGGGARAAGGGGRGAAAAGGSPDRAAHPAAAGQAQTHADHAPTGAAANPQRPARGWWALGGALAAGAAGVVAGALGAGRPAIAPVAGFDAAAMFRPELVERGRQLAALGNCIACHTAEGGAPGAGGRPIDTPFGTVHSTNLTPDPATGIGAWSFSAFQRAMREGVSRDGRHLYPAFPYTAFTQATDDDLQAIYAYLMTRPAVAATTPAPAMAFPYDQRPLLAAWKALNLQPGPVPAVAGQNALWNRGAYLVNGLGHCGACHTPRDGFGGERETGAYLGGAVVRGWEAPALGALSRSPVPWTEAAMQQYLRTGAHPRHGVAGGPMAEAARGLAELPDEDLRAIAHYLVALQGPRGLPAAARPAAGPTGPVGPTAGVGALAGAGDALSAQPAVGPAEAAAAARADALVAQAAARAPLPDATQRLFESACGACHHDGDGPQLLGLNQPLALNSTLHSPRPDNLLRTLLDGIPDPAFPAHGHMPGFRHVYDDRQLAELAAWLRRRFAPDQPPWPDLPAAVARARALRP